MEKTLSIAFAEWQIITEVDETPRKTMDEISKLCVCS
jgi:hypothetical protein